MIIVTDEDIRDIITANVSGRDAPDLTTRDATQPAQMLVCDEKGRVQRSSNVFSSRR